MKEQSGWVYSEKLKEHFKNPRNILKEGEIDNYDGRGIVGNIKCGDQMLMAIKVNKEKGIITDCKWQTYGCASAIASTSLLSEMVKGMTLDEAYHVSPKDIAQELGGLPEHKIHCSVLGEKALRAAINDYYRRNGMQDKIKTEEARIVCQCMNVTDEASMFSASSMTSTTGCFQDIRLMTSATVSVNTCTLVFSSSFSRIDSSSLMARKSSIVR